ncbi:hypothetical protein OPV22_004357 [Ensete ventricosum]|uniref:Uncharacterized protein n=1 Tax=Ensete ventricosum TaxID=4639 RepID=A0AAV8S3J3_ENSVE|nr:hypothetical protein OPV22_004357 [Ensete ventricosum]
MAVLRIVTALSGLDRCRHRTDATVISSLSPSHKTAASFLRSSLPLVHSRRFECSPSAVNDFAVTGLSFSQSTRSLPSWTSEALKGERFTKGRALQMKGQQRASKRSMTDDGRTCLLTAWGFLNFLIRRSCKLAVFLIHPPSQRIPINDLVYILKECPKLDIYNPPLSVKNPGLMRKFILTVHETIVRRASYEFM